MKRKSPVLVDTKQLAAFYSVVTLWRRLSRYQANIRIHKIQIQNRREPIVTVSLTVGWIRGKGRVGTFGSWTLTGTTSDKSWMTSWSRLREKSLAEMFTGSDWKWNCTRPTLEEDPREKYPLVAEQRWGTARSRNPRKSSEEMPDGQVKVSFTETGWKIIKELSANFQKFGTEEDL